MVSSLLWGRIRPARVLLALAGMSLLLMVLACAPTSAPVESEAPQAPAAAADPAVEDPIAETGNETGNEVGNEVGNRIPDFSLDLADGTKVTSVSLVEQGEPAFLFFFSTT